MEAKELETNPQFMQIILPNEIVIFICLQVKSELASGLVNICYPYTTLEPCLPKLDPQYWVASGQTGSGDGTKEEDKENFS